MRDQIDGVQISLGVRPREQIHIVTVIRIYAL